MSSDTAPISHLPAARRWSTPLAAAVATGAACYIAFNLWDSRRRSRSSRRRLDAIAARPLDPAFPALPPCEVLYQDDWYVVINKVAGLLVHPTREAPDDTAFETDRAAAAVGADKLWLVHRLDRPTSGALVFARTSAACGALQAQWHEVPAAVAGRGSCGDGGCGGCGGCGDSGGGGGGGGDGGVGGDGDRDGGRGGAMDDGSGERGGGGSEVSTTGESDAAVRAAAAAVAEAWAALNAQAPPARPPRSGKPPPEHIALMRRHSQRKKQYLAGLTAAQHFRLVGKQQVPRDESRGSGSHCSSGNRGNAGNNNANATGAGAMPAVAASPSPLSPPPPSPTSARRGGAGVKGDAHQERVRRPPAHRKVVKRYLACTHGCMPDRTVCSLPLSRQWSMPERRQAQARRRRRDTQREQEQAGRRHGGGADGVALDAITLDTGVAGKSGEAAGAVQEAVAGGGAVAAATVAGEERTNRVVGGAGESKETIEAAGETVMGGGAAVAAATATAAATELDSASAAGKTMMECTTVFTMAAPLWMHKGEHQLSLVWCELHSGRRHQIRRHLHKLGHPIVGDRNYGRTKTDKWLKAEYGLDRLFLHAAALEFDHPYRPGVTVAVACPLPPRLAGFLRQLPHTELGAVSPCALGQTVAD